MLKKRGWMGKDERNREGEEEEGRPKFGSAFVPFWDHLGHLRTHPESCDARLLFQFVNFDERGTSTEPFSRPIRKTERTALLSRYPLLLNYMEHRNSIFVR